MTKKIVGRLAAALMAGLIAVTSCGFTQIVSADSGEEPEDQLMTEEVSETALAQEVSETIDTAPSEEIQAEEEAELQWIQLSSEEVDAMVGMTSARKRMLLRAGAAIIYEGAMNNFYGGATPHLYDSNGNLVYCILPWSSAPNGVAVNFSDYGISSGSDANLQLMAKLMYYGYGGGGNILGGYSASDQEAITHFALSYVWMINMGNTHGLADWARTGGSRVNETGQAIVMNFFKPGAGTSGSYRNATCCSVLRNIRPGVSGSCIRQFHAGDPKRKTYPFQEQCNTGDHEGQ